MMRSSEISGWYLKYNDECPYERQKRYPEEKPCEDGAETGEMQPQTKEHQHCQGLGEAGRLPSRAFRERTAMPTP